MSISPIIRDVFGHFQNLNLLALLFDLHQDHTARQAWSSGSLLCPVAHGLPAGQQVQQLAVLGQIAELGRGCDFAARCLGADPAAVLRFVRSWDADDFSRDWLFQQLVDVLDKPLFVVVDIDSRSNVHGRNQHHAILHAALAHNLLHLRSDVHIRAMLLGVERQIFSMEFHETSNIRDNSTIAGAGPFWGIIFKALTLDCRDKKPV